MHWIDPGNLPIVRGTIERFIVDGLGEIDGIVLDVGEEGTKLVTFPSYMAHDVGATFKRGDEVIIRGAKLRGADVIVAVAIERSDGAQVIDGGPPKSSLSRISKYGPHKMSAAGKIRLTILTTKGRPRGALLENGVIIRMPLKLAEQIKERLQPGETIEVTGTGFETPHGRIIQVHHFATPVGRYTVRSEGTRNLRKSSRHLY